MTNHNSSHKFKNRLLFPLGILVPVFMILIFSREGFIQAEEPVATPAFIAELLYLNGGLDSTQTDYLSPIAQVVSPDGKTLYVAEKAKKRIDYIEVATGKITKSVPLPKEPTGLALSKDGATLYITCFSDSRPMGIVAVLKLGTGTIEKVIQAGHSPRSPVLSLDENTLYICNQFLNSISIIDLGSAKKTDGVAVIREPYSAALSKNGDYLVVGNFLPNGRSDLAAVDVSVTLSASVSFINTSTKAVSHIALLDGAHSLTDVCLSTSGDYAYVSHVMAKYPIPPTKIEGGWINTNAVSIVEMSSRTLYNTILLDDMDAGAANPGDIEIGNDIIFVTAMGTHELIALQEIPLLAKLSDRVDASNSFSIPFPFKQRISLNVKSPRSVAFSGSKAFVAGYFSDNIDVITINQGSASITGTFTLGTSASQPKSQARKGEELFSDASICHQGWQTCHSCHPYSRTDALNWDLLNDGTGNPKNDKSLLFAHYTPPAMATGIRSTAEVAVRAGLQHILFLTPKEDDASALDEYLKTLRPVPSPYLTNGQLSPSAQRGQNLFINKFQCNICHPPPLYTDLKFHDLGTKGPYDQRSSFDTPTLIENWRTAPYLHDGRYGTLRELFEDGKHGTLIIRPTPEELNDLIEFNNSL